MIQHSVTLSTQITKPFAGRYSCSAKVRMYSLLLRSGRRTSTSSVAATICPGWTSGPSRRNSATSIAPHGGAADMQRPYTASSCCSGSLIFSLSTKLTRWCIMCLCGMSTVYNRQSADRTFLPTSEKSGGVMASTLAILGLWDFAGRIFVLRHIWAFCEPNTQI